MLDFSSALYLGLRHPSQSLRPWDSLTFGAPAALREPEGALRVARELAELQGCERALLAPSTLHLFWDLFGVLSRDNIAVYVDEGIYPIGRWGVERAAARSVPVRTFTHYRADALAVAMRKETRPGKRPIIVSDGFCPACGKPAPVTDYVALAAKAGGLLILDDTQSLGILGHSHSRNNPYGIAGGGVLRWSNNANHPSVLMISSMAKGFGVPVAVLSGSAAMIKHFEERSEVRTHCSPPSIAAIHAAEHALEVNTKQGDRLRWRLLQLVRHFRSRMAEAEFLLGGGLFPVQTLTSLTSRDATTIHKYLLRQGIRTVLHQARTGQGARISFLINAEHRLIDIDTLVDSILYRTKTLKRRQTEAYYDL